MYFGSFGHQRLLQALLSFNIELGAAEMPGGSDTRVVDSQIWISIDYPEPS